MRIFSVNKWCFALGPPSVGQWDRFTSWGVKVKDGAESVFNEDTLGQMVDNFASRKNDLAMCYDHQSAYVAENGQAAPALAWYNALALIVDGQVLKFAAHDADVIAPDPTGLENGVYGYRSEVTPLGEQLLPNYRYLSPMFTDEGADEQGNPIGYDLLDVAATNTPFQDGVGLTYHKGTAERPRKKFSVDPETLKKLGLGEGANGDEIRGAMARYMAESEEKLAKYAADEEARKMADAADEDKKADDKKPEDKDAEKMADDAEDKQKMAADCDDNGKQMADDTDDDATAMARSLGLEGKPSLRNIRYAVEAKMIHAREAVAMRAELEKLRAEASAVREERAQVSATQFADEVIGDGRWPEEKRETIIAMYKKDSDGAKAVLFKKGEFTHVRKNFSKVLEGRSETKTDVGEKAAGPSNRGAEFATKAKAYAKEKGVTLMEAQRVIGKAHPELLNAYKSGE